MKRDQINGLLAKLYLIALLSSALILAGWLMQPYLRLPVRPSGLFGLLAPAIGLLGLAWAFKREVGNRPGV